MSGVTISWNEAEPPITEAAGIGYTRIQSDKTSTRMGLAAEHLWPSAGGLSGAHLLGSARVFYGTQSRVSSDGTDGRLMLTSDTSNLFAMTSAASVFIGGQRVISAFTAPSTLPQRHQWVESFGTSQTPAGESVATITYPDSGFSGIPFVTVTPIGGFGWVSPYAPDFTGLVYAAQLARSRTTDFVVQGFVGDPSAGSSFSFHLSQGIAFQWRSLGTRAL